MIDDNGNVLGPDSQFEFTGKIESIAKPELQEDKTLDEGEYIIYVPSGQRAVIRYKLII